VRERALSTLIAWEENAYRFRNRDFLYRWFTAFDYRLRGSQVIRSALSHTSATGVQVSRTRLAGSMGSARRTRSSDGRDTSHPRRR